jgi:hypothetical protein
LPADQTREFGASSIQLARRAWHQGHRRGIWHLPDSFGNHHAHGIQANRGCVQIVVHDKNIQPVVEVSRHVAELPPQTQSKRGANLGESAAASSW